MTEVLRNNVEVEDKRFDRLEQFDERSRSFPMSSILEQKPLKSYTWRCNSFYDQGSEGACVAYALGHELTARPAEVTGLNNRWLVEKVYWEAQKIDPWNGGSYPSASPFYEGTSVLAGVKVLHRKKLFKSYRWAFSLNELLLGVGYNGPAVIGVPWYSGMINTDSGGYIRPTGYILGGHAVLVRAVDVKKKRVTIRNSWGKNWGVNGDCFMTFDDLGDVLSQRGEAVFMLNRTAKFHEAVFNL